MTKHSQFISNQICLSVLVPCAGVNISLFSLTALAYGNYSVPLLIQDQQGKVVETEFQVIVCDCGGGNECRGRFPVFTKLDGPAIGAMLAGLLLLMCESL